MRGEGRWLPPPPGAGWGEGLGIVALARRLLVDLWRLTETGAVPEGARVKAG